MMVPVDLNEVMKLEAKQDASRACLFNIIIYTHEAERTNYFKGILKMLAQEFPCHIIFIQADQTTKDSSLKVSVSKLGSTDNGASPDPSCNLMVCDQILIEAAGSDLERVPYLILPLFIPDLPIYLIWGEDPTLENKIFDALKQLVKRVIFDSETTLDLSKFAKNVLEELQNDRLNIVDMNWARIGGWRDVLAQTFDSPERIEQLATASRINIIYNILPNKKMTHPANRTIYLQAWLASRLNWHFEELIKEEKSNIVRYKHAAGIVEIHITPESHESFSHEEIIEIEILGLADYECHLVRTALHQVKVHSSNQYQCRLPFTLLMPTLESGRSIMQEIFYHKTSPQYPPTLQIISQTSWSEYEKQ